MPAARAQPSGDLHTTKITPLLPPPPVPAWLCCQCPVVVVGKRGSIVSKVSGFQGPRVNGSQGLNGFKVTKGPRVSGFQGIEAFPILTGVFKGLAFPKSKSFRVQGMKGFRAPRSKDKRAKALPGSHRSKGFKIPRA